MESELFAFFTNQGLAIGISAFLVWWVTTQVTEKLKSICESQTKLCDNQLQLATAVEKILQKLDG
jgi:hypothetical protein